MAIESFRSLISKSTRLPEPPTALPRLLQCLAFEDIEYQELAAVIEQFPTITARLIALANSAWSRPQKPIINLERVCTHIGTKLVRRISVSLAVSAPFNPMRCPSFDTVKFWCSAYLVADGAQWLGLRCSDLEDLEPGTLHTAGLLHNLGLLWLADSTSQKLSQALALVAADEKLHLDQALQTVIGADVSQVTAEVLRAWSLPDVLVIALDQSGQSNYDGEYWQVSAILGAATKMVSACLRGHDFAAEPESFGRLGLSSRDSDYVFGQLQKVCGETRELAMGLGSQLRPRAGAHSVLTS